MNITLKNQPFWVNRLPVKQKGVLIVILLFVITIAPFSLSYIFMASSEQFYTDGAIHMMENGDYTIPYFDGELRFKKPILTYWWVLTSFKVLGVDFWTAMLPFLLTGIGLLWLTAKTARLLTNRTAVVILSVLILATHPLLIFSTARSMTDLPLVFTIMLAVYGAVGLLKFEGNKKQYLYFFYAGFGASIAIKGAPGLILGFGTLLYLIFNPYLKLSWRKLLQPLPILLGTVLAGFWFLIVYLRFPEEFTRQFYTDQVGGRFIERLSQMASNLSTFTFTFFYAAPWVLMALFRIKSLKIWFIDLPPLFKGMVGMTCVWVIAFALTAPFFTIYYDRYFMPAIPLLSILFASVILTKEHKNVDKVSKYVVLIPYCITLALLVVSILFFYKSALIWYAVAINGLGILISKRFTPEIVSKLLLTITFCIWGAYLNIGALVATAVNPNVGRQIADKLIEKNVSDDNIVFFYADTKIPAKLRIASYNGTRAPYFKFHRIEDVEKLVAESPGVILFEEAQLPQIKNLPNQYTIEKAATQYEALNRIAFLQKYLKKQKSYYVATRK